MSCDKFSVVWPAFFQLFNEFWPDFNGPSYLYSETKEFREEGVRTINSGLDGGAKNWSDGLAHALERIPEEYILLMLEDFFLDRTVRSNVISECLDTLRSDENIGCVRLVPVPAGKGTINGPLIEHEKGAPYRISTQIAVWRKRFLQDVLRSGESPWEFELNGTKRSEDMEPEVWTVLTLPPEKRSISHKNALIRGKMTRDAARAAMDAGVEIPAEIPVNTAIEEYYWFRASDMEKRIMDFINHRLYKFLWKQAL